MTNSRKDLESETEEHNHEESQEDKDKLAQEIEKRAENPLVNQLVRERAKFFAKQVRIEGINPLARIEMDFYDPELLKSKTYSGWRKVELKELYRVLYGHRME